jgi:hypothetical protein
LPFLFSALVRRRRRRLRAAADLLLCLYTVQPRLLGHLEFLRNRDWVRGHFPRGQLSHSLPLRHLSSLLNPRLSHHTQYLRIKRAVQAAFNTEASYLSAKLSQVQAGGAAAQEAVNGGAEVDPMSALDAATSSGAGGALGGAFVAASKTSGVKGNVEEKEQVVQGNADEIAMDDDDDDDE